MASGRNAMLITTFASISKFH